MTPSKENSQSFIKVLLMIWRKGKAVERQYGYLATGCKCFKAVVEAISKCTLSSQTPKRYDGMVEKGP